MSQNGVDDADGMEWILAAAKRQLDAYGVDRVVTAFLPVLNEFEAYTEGVAIPDAYRERLGSFVAFLKSAFALPPTTAMLVQTARYSTDMWGPLYWSFLHYASILLQHALHVGLAGDVREFPTLVYNVEKMLPCGVCVAHYGAIKRRNTALRYAVKLISFGHVVQGLYQFHNVVSENVHEHGRAGGFRPFTPIEFARRYHCYPLTTISDAAQHKSFDYSRPRVDWQTPLHVSVTVVLVIRYNVSYSRVSNYLKRLYDPTGAYTRPTVYTAEDRRFEFETRLRDLYDALVSGTTGATTKIGIGGGGGSDEEEKEKMMHLSAAGETIRAAFREAGKKLPRSANPALENKAFNVQ